MTLRKRVAYVPERPRYYDWMTVAEIGWFSCRVPRQRIPGPLPRVGAASCCSIGKSRLSTLSKGQYAKVGLALALAIDPEVLILDEPTSGLDVLGAA